VPEFDHDQTRYPLRGMHKGVACTQCHLKPVFTNVGTKCADCHADIHRRQFGASCEQCHTVRGWQVSVQQINQHQNRFPLIGAHAALDCEACHKGAATGQFQGLATQCYACHAKDYQTAQPSHIAGKFSTTCEECHGLNTWLGAKFDHLAATGFALTGAHATLECTACHVGGKFAGTPAACIGCHMPDFQSASNPNHVQAGFPQTCQTCHSTAAWSPATFDHNAFTQFPLTGAHATVACSQCHVNGQFAGTPTACVGCHLKDFQGTTEPNHVQAGFPQTCQSCHTTANWNASFDHSTTGFALTGAHTSLQCAQCHINGNYNLTDTSCVSCHLKDFQGTTQPNHVQAGFPQTCQTCHTTTNWNASFDHSTTGFPLTGAHTSVQCAQCHVNNNYNLSDTSCVSCHLKDFQGTTNPNHAQTGIPQTCQNCHSTTSWDDASFDHSTTGFPLTGAHTAVSCTQCHVNNNYNLTDTSCVSCHLKDFQGTTQPNHVQAGFPQTCQNCHNTVAWSGATFDHNNTGFPLTGAHTSLPCEQCHVNSNYHLTDTACVSCHLKDFQGTTDPNHVQAGFPQTCQTCHTTSNWNASFNHSTTGFPLTGAHTTLQCAQCHTNGNYGLTDTSCVSCHLRDYQGTTDPNHVQAGFPQTCQNCHTTTNWNASFDHSTTGFPLTGAHTTLQCAQCHVNGNYNLTSTACVSCHLADYQGATDPNHVQAGFPQTCQSCHTTTNWNASFDHSTTGFPLTGAHTTLQCAQCHVNNNYNLTNTACVACHLTDYQGATNPNHVQAGFPQTCQSCHTTTNWNASFDHSTTGFPLTGAHTTLQCAQCHVNGNYALSTGACVSCHLSDYQGTTDPNHVQAGFPQTCESCHSTTSWAGATFNHASTGFALTGAHASLQCAQCHVNGNYNLTNTACVACHLANFNSTTNPNHVTSGFPQQCEVCHNTTAWTPSSFNHNNTAFPLTGAHTTVACANCHVNNNYTTVPTDCYSCHRTDYQGTTNPNHAAAGFPTTCQTCHTTTSWQGATFDHTWFPTNHGGAGGVCATCHTNSSDYSIFQCTNCHAQTQTDRDHGGVRNYIYNSTNCYQCHPSGRGG
jgi:hypothetical protein